MNKTAVQKILFVTHYKEMYGANRSLLNLMEGLQQRGNYGIVLLAPMEGPIVEKVRSLGVRCLVLPFHNEIYFQELKGWMPGLKNLVKFALNLVYTPVIVAKLRRERIAVVHSNSSATLMGAYLSCWWRKPHVWHVREFGWEDYKVKYNFGYGYFQYWLRRSACAIAISRAIMARRLEDSHIRRKELIYNGVISQADLAAKRLRPVPAARKVIRFSVVGFISEEKNQREALLAFCELSKRYSHLELRIIGTGVEAYIAEMKAMVKQHGLEDKVLFTGYLDQADAIYGQTDCLLMCARNEALGRVTIEAMSFGVPVIGFDHAGTSELIKEDHNGFLYKGGPAELAAKMELLITMPDRLDALRQHCFNWVEEHFTIEQCVQQVEHVYKGVIK